MAKKRPNLEEELIELEKTDPEVGKAAASYDQMVDDLYWKGRVQEEATKTKGKKLAVKITKDNTIYKYDPETRAEEMWQFNILFADGSTSSGFDDIETAQYMLDNNTPEDQKEGAVFIKRKITTTVITERDNWTEA